MHMYMCTYKVCMKIGYIFTIKCTCIEHTISGYIPADSLTLAKLNKDSEDGGTTSSQVKARKREVLVDVGNQDN